MIGDGGNEASGVSINRGRALGDDGDGGTCGDVDGNVAGQVGS